RRSAADRLSRHRGIWAHSSLLRLTMPRSKTGYMVQQQMWNMNRFLTVASLFLALAVAALAPAAAQSPLFDGKTITYIVATKPGGGYDTMGRLVARYLEKQLPGSTIIVK